MIHEMINKYACMDSDECIQCLTHILYNLYPTIVPDEKKSLLISRLMKDSHIGHDFNLDYYFNRVYEDKNVCYHYIQHPEGRFGDFIEVGFYGHSFWVSVVRCKRRK